MYHVTAYRASLCRLPIYARWPWSAAVAILKATALDKLARPTGPTDGQKIIDAMVAARFKAKCAAKDDAYMGMLTSNPLRDDAADEAAARAEVEAEIAVRLGGG